MQILGEQARRGNARNGRAAKDRDFAVSVSLRQAASSGWPFVGTGDSPSRSECRVLLGLSAHDRPAVSRCSAPASGSRVLWTGGRVVVLGHARLTFRHAQRRHFHHHLHHHHHSGPMALDAPRANTCCRRCRCRSRRTLIGDVRCSVGRALQFGGGDPGIRHEPLGRVCERSPGGLHSLNTPKRAACSAASPGRSAADSNHRPGMCRGPTCAVCAGAGAGGIYRLLPAQRHEEDAAEGREEPQKRAQTVGRRPRATNLSHLWSGARPDR
jgi:hypothetical protein